MTTRYYSSISQQTTLTGSISAGTTVFSVAAATGFPSSTPFTLALDYNTASEELVQVNTIAGTSLTVDRAVDGTSATSHSAGAVVRHVSSARDFADSRTHENSTTNVHGTGIGSAVVGTNDIQTLNNKTLNNPTITGTVALVSPTITGTVAGGATYTSPTLGGTTTVAGNVDVNGTAAGTSQLDVMGAPSQSAALQRWINSSAVTLASIEASGKLFANKDAQVTAGTAADTAFVVKGLTSQTGNLTAWQNSSSTVLAGVSAAGNLFANVGAHLVGPPSPSTGGVELKAGPSSIHIVELQNTSGSQVADVLVDGTAEFKDFTALNASAYTKVTNTANIGWTTSTGLHTPSYGNATMTYLYKIVAGTLHFHMSIDFGSTTNFGTSVTNVDNWRIQMTSGGVYNADPNFVGIGVPVGFGRATVSTGITVPVLVKVSSAGNSFEFDTAGGQQDGGPLANTGTVDSITPGTWSSASALQYWGTVPVTPSF